MDYYGQIMKTKRDIGIDLLRILLALMVIAIHFNAPGTGHVALSSTSSPVRYLVSIVVALTYPAVNTYVLISGYYSYKNRKSYQQIVNGLIKLWICLVFFSVGGYIGVTIFNNEGISLMTIIERCFPLSRGEWWFMSDYFIMMLLSPLINVVLDALGRKETIVLVLISLMFCSIIPFFLKWDDAIGINNGYSLLWFLVMYITGASVSMASEKRILNTSKPYLFFLGYLACSAILIALNGLLSIIPLLKGYHFWMYNSIIVYFQAVLLFSAFKDIKIERKWINKSIYFLSGLSLAAYIFHCQEDIGHFIWSNLRPDLSANSVSIIPLFFITVVGIYFVSITIEYIRRSLLAVGNIEKKLISKLTNIIVTEIKRFL